MLKRKILSALIMSTILTICILVYEWYRTTSLHMPLTFEELFWVIIIIIIYIYPITICYSIFISSICEYILRTPISLFSLVAHLIAGALFMFLAAFYYNPSFFISNFPIFLSQSIGYMFISILCSFLYWALDCYLFLTKNKNFQSTLDKS